MQELTRGVTSRLFIILVSVVTASIPLFGVTRAGATFSGQNGQVFQNRYVVSEYTNSLGNSGFIFGNELVSLDLTDSSSDVIVPFQIDGDQASYLSFAGASISPDGQILAFVKVIKDLLTQTSYNELWISDSFGFNSYKIMLDNVTSVDWSPDNHTLLISINNPNNGDVDLHTLDITSQSSPQPLLTGLESSPVDAKWSPNGKTIAYTNHNSSPAEVYLLDVSSGLSEQTSSGELLPKVNVDAESINYRWEPGNTLLVEEAGGESWYIYRYSLPLDLYSPVLVLNNASYVLPSPDGSSLLFHRYSQDFSQIELYSSTYEGENEAFLASYPLGHDTHAAFLWQALPPTSLSVQPHTVNIQIENQQQLTTTAHYSDASSQDVTGQATYTSDNTTVATVDNTGLVTGSGVGQATITVSFAGLTNTVDVIVNPVAPQPPTNMTINNGTGSGSLNLAWSAPADDGGSPVTSYLVFRRTGTGGTFSQIASVPASSLSYTDSGLTTGTTYYYYVTAVNSVGQSNPSSTVSQQAPGILGNPICIFNICI